MALVENIKLKIDSISTISLHTNKLGLARSLLAFGTLSTFLFNDVTLLFNTANNTGKNPAAQIPYTLFDLLGSNNLILAKVICIAVLLAVISGVYPKLTAIPHWFVSWSYFNSTAIIDGGDQVTAVLTLLLIPICLSDNRKNHWLPAVERTANSAKYINIINYSFFILIQVQVSLIYFEAAVDKFKVDDWTNGTSVYYWLSHSWFGVPVYLSAVMKVIIENPYGITLMTWGTIVVELLLFMSILMSVSAKKFMLYTGLCLHLLFMVFFGLFSFYFAMAGALILYLGNIKSNFHIPFLVKRQWKTQY